MMRKGKSSSWMTASVLAIFLAGCCGDNPLGVAEGGAGGPATVALGTAGAFGVLANTDVTNTGTTTITGDLGVSPGTTVTGFPPGTVSGSIHTNDAAAISAQTALAAAIADVAGRSAGLITVSGNLGSLTLAPGLYNSTSALTISGPLTLNAVGDTNAVFIIRTASTLTTAAGSEVILTGGAQASNVYWLVGSTATLGANSEFQGNILADNGITLNTGARVDGRLLTQNGGVTLDDNVIVTP
jgi:cytoskeletal protein CcmA (bactofilin family)